jgi:histidinol-phosphate phosphatase family protein
MKKDKVVFLDRDGVINKDPAGWTPRSYVSKWEYFEFLPGAREALRKLKSNGYRIIVLSNQAGVGKGYFSERDLERINDMMVNKIKEDGADVDAVYYCIHKSDDYCSCRKPRTGLFDRAKNELGVNPAGKCFVGDGITDIMAGKNAGCKTIFVKCGKTSLAELRESGVRPDRIEENLLKATEWILKNETE